MTTQTLTQDAAALTRIHALLDGREWNGADDLAAIAAELDSVGFVVGPPGAPAGPREGSDGSTITVKPVADGEGR